MSTTADRARPRIAIEELPHAPLACRHAAPPRLGTTPRPRRHRRRRPRELPSRPDRGAGRAKRGARRPPGRAAARLGARPQHALNVHLSRAGEPRWRTAAARSGSPTGPGTGAPSRPEMPPGGQDVCRAGPRRASFPREAIPELKGSGTEEGEDEEVRQKMQVKSSAWPRGGMADAVDLKSAARKGVPVRVRAGLPRGTIGLWGPLCRADVPPEEPLPPNPVARTSRSSGMAASSGASAPKERQRALDRSHAPPRS